MAVLTGVRPHLLPRQVIPGLFTFPSAIDGFLEAYIVLSLECQALILECCPFTNGPSTPTALTNLLYLLLSESTIPETLLNAGKETFIF